MTNIIMCCRLLYFRKAGHYFGLSSDPSPTCSHVPSRPYKVDVLDPVNNDLETMTVFIL